MPACPPTNRGGLSGGAIRNEDCGGFCQFWFLWVSALLVVFRRAKNIRLLLCPRFIPAYRRDFTCGLRRTRLFLSALLNSVKRGGAQAFTRERIMPLVLSLRSNPRSNIVSRITRPRCKPAWFPGSLQPHLIDLPRIGGGDKPERGRRACGVNL